jgi:hypothetical protein
MFTHCSKSGFRDALPGIQFKALAHGKRTLFAEFTSGRAA